MLDARLEPYLPLFDAFEARGYELYFVGGCVRDLVMGEREMGDVDLATSAPVEATKDLLTAAGFPAHPIGERFGTVMTLLDGVPVEITTFRVDETYDHGSRHPEVTFGEDIAADLSRRDLSINAMAMDRNGSIVDPYDGATALQQQRLEVPGGGYENTLQILRDDPLRLLRIARFAARFGFRPTPDTTRAAEETAGELAHISHERWKMELDKLLVAGELPFGLSWLDEVGALEVLFPELSNRDAFDASALGERLRSLDPDPVLRWAGLLLGVGGWPRHRDPSERLARATEVAARFRFSNADRARVERLTGPHIDEIAVEPKWAKPSLRRWYTAVEQDAFGQLDLVDALVDDEPARDTGAVRRALVDLLDEEDPIPRLPTGLGRHVARAFDLKGPEIGAAMEQVRDGIFDGKVANGADIEVYLDWLKGQR